jgi:hypothetical protein
MAWRSDGARSRTHTHDPIACGAARRGGGVTAEPTRTTKHSRVHNFLGQAADDCGAALNSFLFGFGDKCGLMRPISTAWTWRSRSSGALLRAFPLRRRSSDDGDGSSQAHGSATQGQMRAVSIHREETAFMTLIGHDCLAARDSDLATP